MKKFTILSLFFLCLSINFILISNRIAFSQNLIKQGVYTLSDLNKTKDNLYEIKNTSSIDSVFIAIFDEDNIIVQSIQLSPNSSTYNLIPIKPDYKIVVLGKGDVFIEPKIPK